MVPSDRTGADGHSWKCRTFPLSIRKHIFPVRLTKPWHSLPREVVESPSLRRFRTYLDMVLSSCCRWPYLGGAGGDQMSSRSLFESQPLCYSVIQSLSYIADREI